MLTYHLNVFKSKLIMKGCKDNNFKNRLNSLKY